MSEITVLVDVRPSPDSPDLLLVRQKLVIEGGELRLVGVPTEEKMPLAARRAKISMSTSIDMQIGSAAVARVQNIGMVPLDISKVHLEYRYPEAVESPVPALDSAIGGSFGLIPRERKVSGALLPGESREWVLPLDYYGEALLQEIARLGPGDYKIVAYAGPDAVAEAPGKLVQPHLDIGLDRYKSTWGLKMQPHIHHKLIGFDAETRDQIFAELKTLQEKPTEEWSSLPGVIPVEGNRFFLTVPPEYQVLVRRVRRGPVEVLDVLRRPEATLAAPVGGTSGSAG